MMLMVVVSECRRCRHTRHFSAGALPLFRRDKKEEELNKNHSALFFRLVCRRMYVSECVTAFSATATKINDGGYCFARSYVRSLARSLARWLACLNSN